jgi:hypothetical protein
MGVATALGGVRSTAAVVHVSVLQVVKDSEKSSVLFSTTTITISKAYLKMSSGFPNMVEVSFPFVCSISFIHLFVYPMDQYTIDIGHVMNITVNKNDSLKENNLDNNS